MSKIKKREKDTSPKIPQIAKIKDAIQIRNVNFTEKQKQLIQVMRDKNTKLVFVSGPAGTAKAQPLDADVLCETGFCKMADVVPGTKVFGENGNLYNVISIHPQGIKDIYKISFSDGTSTESTLDHLWKTQTSDDRNQRKWSHTVDGVRKRLWSDQKEGTVKTTEMIMNSLYVRNNTRINHSIKTTSPIKFRKKDHLISSYMMGVLLGDGCFRKIGSVSFSSNDIEIVERLTNELLSKNLKLTKNGKFDYVISHIDKSSSVNGNIIKNEIRRLNLDGLYSHEKFIPTEYLIDSVDNRLDLLRGLMDSDGTVSKNGVYVSFTSTSFNLINCVKYIIESLGGVCGITQHQPKYTYLKELRFGKIAYTMSVCLPETINPFWVKRKASLVVGKTKYKPIRYITDVKLVDKKPCQCILVDNPSHLYMTNNFIVTHNTFTTILAGLHLINDKRVSDLIYIRTAVESSDSKLGFLPGEMDDKMSPYIQPLIDKLEEILHKGDIDKLKKEERIHGIPANFLRGLNWNARCIVADEAQNMTRKELITLITRVGEFSKLFVCGDPDQSDINGKSGFVTIMNYFDDDESRSNGIFIFKFNEDDVVRSGLVKFILKKLKKIS